MKVKDLIMPINYFSLESATFALNSAVFSLSGLILMVSTIFEYMNERDLWGPSKRFMVAVMFLITALPIQNFVVNKSFQVSDYFLESLADSEKLIMLTDPEAFMDKLSEMHFANNTVEETTEEEIGDTGVVAKVTNQNINFAGVIFDQLKNIPNFIIGVGVFGFISFCLFFLQASYYILYFTTGALVAIPAIFSIFPFFEGSLSGAFKSLGVLFITPIFVSLIAAMLAIKMAELGTNSLSAGDSIHTVAMLCALCVAMSSSILLAAGLLSASGLSQNLGAVGAISSAAAMNGALKLGNSAWSNKAAIGNGFSKAGSFFNNGGSGLSNVVQNSANLAKQSIKSLGSGSGPVANAVKPLNKAIESSSTLKSGIKSKASDLKDFVNHHASPLSKTGRTAGLVKAMTSKPESFQKTLDEQKAIKSSGIKKVKATGTIEPYNMRNARLANQKEEALRSPNVISKSHLLYNNKSGFNTGIKQESLSRKSPSNNQKPSKAVRRKGKLNSNFSENHKKTKKPYKLNNWEKKFLETMSTESNPTKKQLEIKNRIEDVQRNGL